ncbi:protein KINESIN LIGHT CHAIN-RELATED 3-like [Macadamia integrifolia]|uniref:protein KINESIN LIGHT CHAIN-RELATED 3-like n=1 Tax=Macadamia integrifolia TaxID=60698 RepID=UPI001C501419|nr:protein KINESIN LIGHT CHAIN-RELATED 3-like [Macadamia integrifolia]
MPGVMGEGIETDLNRNSSPFKEKVASNRSPRSPGSPRSEALDHHLDGAVNTSIEQLYENICEMQSSDQSPSRRSYGSYGDESRVDSELRHLVGGDMGEVEIMQDEEKSEDTGSDSVSKKENGSVEKKSGKLDNTHSTSPKSAKSASSVKWKKPSKVKVESCVSTKINSKSKKSSKPPIDKRGDKNSPKSNARVVSLKKQKDSALEVSKSQMGAEDTSEAGSESLELGPSLLQQARDLISSGDNPHKALKYALRAVKSFEKCLDGKPSLDLVMNLHVIAAIHCILGQYGQAIPVLERSIEIPVMEEGHDHALAKFAGHMQLGDTYATVGQLENSIMCYTRGLEIQKQVLGEVDPRVGETCRYLAEAHVQALQFDEAEKLCQMALDIHRENGQPASLEEAADRRLMGLICETKGDHEAALEHLVLASMTMVANGQESEVASVDCSIGDTYLSLARFDEAICSYQKALAMFKSSKGENHPTVASVFVRLADLHNKIGQVKESKSYCENALRIYGKTIPGIPREEIASGLTDVSAIYESLNEPEQALKLLQKALKIYVDSPGQQSTIAGIEAQMGVMYYMLGNYSESYTSFKNAVSKLRASGEKKSAFFGIALNQMGLVCVKRYAINEAADLFEEARSILEQEYGPYHPDTLGVYSNLAGTYDAMGRLDDAIGILEYVVGMREEKLGTANPDVDDEKRRLAELLKEAGRVRNRKARSLETLLVTNSHPINEDGIMV